MLIRSATKSDAALLAALHEQCFPNYWQHETFTDFFSVAGTFGLVAEKVPSGECLVPSEKKILGTNHQSLGTPIAMIIYRILYEQAEIITLAVHPGWRRQGIAKELLEKSMAQAAASGAKTLFLDVEEGNHAATQLYESYGFSLISRRTHYYRQKDGSFTDALVMSRKLSG